MTQRISNNTIVALITMDSVRPDHLGCYGYGRSATTFLDHFSSNGIQFNNAFSPGGGTPDAFPSIMCACPPPLHLKDRDISGRKTIANLLRECGFSTAAFHSNPFLSATRGYGEGFDNFDDSSAASPWLPASLEDIQRAANLVFLNRGPFVDCWSLARKTIRWLKTTPRPVFLWVHFMDTHFPFVPPTTETGLVMSMKNRALWLPILSRKLQQKRTQVQASTKSVLEDAYDACIRALDRCLAVLVGELFRSFNNRLLVLTADHGEAFWEHGYFGHTGVHDEVIKVPLVLYGDDLPKGKIIRRPVSLTGILPTIAGLVGHVVDTGTAWSLVQPGDAAPIGEEKFVSTSLDPPSGRRFIGVRTPRFKFISEEALHAGKEVAHEQLYDLVNDPKETVDISSKYPDEVSVAKECIQKTYGDEYLIATHLSEENKRTDITDRDEARLARRLRSLGYL